MAITFPPPPATDDPITPAFQYDPRWYQKELFAAMAPRDESQAKKHGLLIWPRRRGKDISGLNFLVTKALRRKGSYYYFFPTYRLGKRVIWDGMDDASNTFRSYIPAEVTEDSNETEMQITLANGSMLYILGADKIDITARGTNVVGVIYSEWRDMSPIVRRTIAPILGNNDGWELIITTPRGHNHVHDLVKRITTKPELAKIWYYSFHTIETCSTGPEDLAKSLQHLEALRLEGVPEEWIQQEYYCSFEGFQEGSFFSEALSRCYKENRVRDVPVMDNALVHTASDLGTGLSFATWYWQEVGDWIHIVDFSELPAGGMPEFKRMLQAKGYTYGDHFAPFDIDQTEVGTGLTRLETAQDLGMNFLPLPRIKAVGDRINAGRMMFPRVVFDQQRCQVGLSHLLNYRREYDEKSEVYKEKEVHDKHSHGGAAFTYMAMGVGEIGETLRRGQSVAEMDFDEFTYDTRWTRVAEDGYDERPVAYV